MEPGLLIDRSAKFGICRPDADLTLDAVTNVVKLSIRRAKRLALDGLVVAMPEVKGFPPPTVSQRQDMATEVAESARDEMIKEWARMAANRIRLVVVTPGLHPSRADRRRLGHRKGPGLQCVHHGARCYRLAGRPTLIGRKKAARLAMRRSHPHDRFRASDRKRTL